MNSPEAASVAELQAEIDRLRAELATQQGGEPPAAPRPKRHVWRTLLSAVAIFLAVLLAPVSAISTWANQYVNNADVYVSTMSDLAENPEIQAAVSNRLTTVILAKTDLRGLADDAVATIAQNRDLTDTQTAALGLLADAAANSAADVVAKEVSQAVSSDQFAQVWVAANTAVHAQLVAWLSGDESKALQIEGDALVVDVSALLTQVKDRLQQRGIALADKIPTDVEATVVLVESEYIGSVQQAYGALSALGFWMPILVLLLAITGILIAQRRRTAVLGLGLGLLAMSVLFLGVVTGAERFYLGALPDTVNTAAAQALFTTMTAYLVGIYWAGLALGAVITVGGLLMGDGRVAADIRRRIAGFGEWVRDLLAGWGLQMHGLRSSAVPAAAGLRIAVCAVAAVLLLFIPLKTASSIAWITAGLVLALLLIEVIAGGRDEEPAATTAPTAS